MSLAGEDMAPDLQRARQVATDALMEHLAADHLSVEDFEARLALVASATTAAELRGVLSGLPGRSADPPPGVAAEAARLRTSGPNGVGEGAMSPAPGRRGLLGGLLARALRTLGLGPSHPS